MLDMRLVSLSLSTSCKVNKGSLVLSEGFPILCVNIAFRGAIWHDDLLEFLPLQGCILGRHILAAARLGEFEAIRRVPHRQVLLQVLVLAASFVRLVVIRFFV